MRATPGSTAELAAAAGGTGRGREEATASARGPSPLESEQESLLAREIGLLRDPASYPRPTHRVDALETHLSWVFLTDDRAYKLKKPFRWPFVDLRTPELRRGHCQEEVRLNRRLAPAVYLGIVPVVVGGGGQLGLGGEGTPIDWLVEMQRLPSALMLDRRIAEGTATADDAARLAEVLSAFYRSQPPERVEPESYAQGIQDDVVAGARDLEELAGTVPHALVMALAYELEHFCRASRPILGQRAAGGRLLEGHGDLRPDHVCLLPRPVVIDCLELDRRLRILDPVDEICFLAMECTRLGAPEVGAGVLDAYYRLTGDRAPAELERFYRAYRAFCRARVTLWHLRDPHVEHPRRWVLRATDYLRLSATELAAAGGTLT